ncbi:MAG TPA: DUF4255 domain-containing protein [Bacillota bacterium]|nr:DUF4255 domain-containing protein [Bacillota bacterium]
MNQTTVLRDLGSLLKCLLKYHIAEITDESSVTFESPAVMGETAAPKLSLFLYQVCLNSQLRNSEPIYDDKTQQWLDPPVALDLYFLITPYAKDRETELLILEKIIALFQNQWIFKDLDQGSGADLDEIITLQKSLAATGNENIRIVPHDIPQEELNRLWERFSGKPFKLGISYLMTPVRIPMGTGYRAPQIREKVIKVGGLA